MINKTYDCERVCSLSFLETEVDSTMLTAANLDHAFVVIQHGFWLDGDKLRGNRSLADRIIWESVDGGGGHVGSVSGEGTWNRSETMQRNEI